MFPEEGPSLARDSYVRNLGVKQTSAVFHGSGKVPVLPKQSCPPVAWNYTVPCVSSFKLETPSSVIYTLGTGMYVVHR